MPSRNLYVFIGESFREAPDVSREILGATLTTSLKLSRHRLRAGLVDVALLGAAQFLTIMWALDAWLMFPLACALTVKQLKTIKAVNVDLLALIAYTQLANEKVMNYGQQGDLFAGQATVQSIHKLD